MRFTSFRIFLPFQQKISWTSAAVAAGLLCCTQPSAIHAAPASAAPQAASATTNSASGTGPGAKAYADNCAICHGDHREGNLPAFPPLVGIQHQLTDQQITDIITKGKDRMPPIADVKGDSLKTLLEFLHSGNDSAPGEASKTNTNSAQIDAGRDLFQQNCAFCHGRDTMGGETGPDLTRSRVVRNDKHGEKISEVVRNGRPAKKMPAFNFSEPELQGIVAFIHAQAALAANAKGGRRGVDVADLQTGNVDAGKRYFNGAGGCAKCHSPTGDLAGIAEKYEGLALEMRMLYPRDVKSTVSVTLRNGKKLEGTLAYLDEFTIGMRDGDGAYHSWAVGAVKYKVNAPVEAHAEQFPKYTDENIHDLMAYIQTLH